MNNLKHKIGFLFTGHIRSNPLGFTTKPNYTILNSFNKYIFTEEFKNKYDYDIFLSTDTIDTIACNAMNGIVVALKFARWHSVNSGMAAVRSE